MEGKAFNKGAIVMSSEKSIRKERKLSILQEELKSYKSFLKGARKAKFEQIQNESIELSVGDIVVMYGSIMTYGIVVDISETKSKIVFLTTNLLLSSQKALKLRINHLVNTVAVSPIDLSIPNEKIRLCAEKIGRIPENLLKKVLENHDVLKRIENGEVAQDLFGDMQPQTFGKTIQEYYNLERSRILESLDLDNQKNVVKIRFTDYFRKEEFVKQYASLLAAENVSTISGDGYILELDAENNALKIYFDDRYVSTLGEIEFNGKLVYSGEIPSILEIIDVPMILPGLAKELMKVRKK